MHAALGTVAASLLPASEIRAQVTAGHRAKMGIAQFSFNVRLRAERQKEVPVRINDPLPFLQYSHALGAGGIQTGLGKRELSYAHDLRRYAEEHGLFIEGSCGLPRTAADLDRFKAEMQTAQQAGARVVRTAMGGRRYEQFETLDQFQSFLDRSWRSLQLAEPIAAQFGLALAVENHKDFRVHQMLAMLERLSSEHVGVCLDTGNSFALLEDPMEVVRAYAPWARSAHLKDMAVCEYGDGFLLADVPLGQGQLDLPEMVRLMREAHPGIAFSLEMATREALEVPCLTEGYWATLGDVSGRDLARTLRIVRAGARTPAILPQVKQLPLSEQIQLEEQNIKSCLRYAEAHLNL
jgi:sugar phosphate isomerase/epimerase